MLNQIATSNKARGKGLNFKKFSGKCWALVCASLLISGSTQATHPEFEDWSFDQDGNFYTSTGKLIKPWDQPKELRQAKELGLDQVQTLLNDSALRIARCNNGDFVLHLYGRLRGGGGGQSTLSGESNQYGGQRQAYHCSRASSTHKFCWVKSGDFSMPNSAWQGGNPGKFNVVSNPNYQRTPIYSGSGYTYTPTGGWGNKSKSKFKAPSFPHFQENDSSKFEQSSQKWLEEFEKRTPKLSKKEKKERDEWWRKIQEERIEEQGYDFSDPSLRYVSDIESAVVSEKNLSFGISDLSNIKNNKSIVGFWEKELLGKPHETKPHYIHSKNIAGNIGFLDKERGIVYTAFLKDRKYTNSFLVVGYEYPPLHKQLGEWFLNHYWDSRHLLNKGLIGGMGSTWYETKQSDIQAVARACGVRFYHSLGTRVDYSRSRYSHDCNSYEAEMLLYKYGEETARKFGVKPALYRNKRKNQGEPRYPGNKSTQEYMKKKFEEQVLPKMERVEEVHTGPIHRVFSEPKKRTTTDILHTFGTVLNTAGPRGVCKISKDFENTCPDTSKCLLDAAK